MIIDLYYSTVGLMLDIMIVTIPILFHFNVSKSTRIKTYITIYLLTYVTLVLPFDYITQYLIIFFGIALSLYFIIKVDFRKFFLYVTYFGILFAFDYGYVFMPPSMFLVYSLVYKVILLKFIKNIFIKIDMELKEKILSGASVSGIIILSIIIGGIYVNK